MAFDWEHVEAIRAEQDSARNRRDLNTLPTNEVSNEIYSSPSGMEAKIPGLDHWEQMIHKVRTQLIDYIIEHGLVQGFEYDGINEPIKNGKIVLTAEMLQRVTDRFGYFKEKETLEFIEKYLPEHHYIADKNYVHTDNNFTDAEKAKLEGIADGAEVNKVISILFNGAESIDPETRVATITITPADVKAWYEQNPDTNVFTDAEKAKLESINLDELSNKVEDVTLDGETIVKDKVAVLTAKKIKDSYESNADTNAFTDADKALVEHVLPEIQKNVNQHEQRIDALEESQTVQDAEIKDVKDSISELGDEVNSVAGRVTTLEASQKTQDGRLDAMEGKNAEQGKRLDALETSEATQDADIEQLKIDVKNAGKVDDVKVGGVSVVTNKVAKIPKIPDISNLVPYTGADKAVNLGSHDLIARNIGATDGTYGISIQPDRISTTEKNILFEGNMGDPATLSIGEPTKNGHAATKKYVDDSILAIPPVDTSNLVPYSGATEDVNIGNHSLVVATTKQKDLTTRRESYSLNANIGVGALEDPGVSIKTKRDEFYPDKDTPYSQLISMDITPGNFSVLARTETSTGTRTDKAIELTKEGFKVKSMGDSVLITDTSIKGLADPDEGQDAANKKYVDESIAKIPEVDVSNLVPYTGATADVNLDQHSLKAEHVKLGTDSVHAYMSINGITVNGSTTPFTFRMNEANGNFTFRGSEAELISPIIGEPTADNQAATKKYVDDSIPTIKSGAVGIDLSADKPIIPANSVFPKTTKTKTLPPGSKFVGIQAVNVGTGTGTTNLMGMVSLVNQRTLSTGEVELLFEVYICNPYTEAIRLNTMTVTFSYV